MLSRRLFVLACLVGAALGIGGFTFRDVHIQSQTGLKITNAKDVSFLDSSITVKDGEPATIVGSTGIRRP